MRARMKEFVFLIEQFRYYWPIITAGAVVLSGLLAFLLKWQAFREAPLKKQKLLYEVQKAKREQEEVEFQLARQKLGTVFDNIRVRGQNKYWVQKANDYFTLNDRIGHANPSFDIVIRNNSRSTYYYLGSGRAHY